MTTEIYVQTTEVVGDENRHLAIWIVQDGETTIIDAKASGLLGIGYETTHPTGNLFYEKVVVQDTPGTTEIETFNLNLLNLTSQQAEDAATDILNYYDSVGASLSYDNRDFRDTGIGYDLLGPNSNSVGNTFLSVAGINLNDLNLYEDGDDQLTEYTVAAHPGHDELISGSGSDTLVGFSDDEDNVFHDIDGGDDAFYGGALANNVRWDDSDGDDTVRYEGLAAGAIEVHDSYRAVQDNNGGTYDDVLYSIEKVTFSKYSPLNTLDYSNYGQAITADGYNVVESTLAGVATGVEVTEDTGEVFTAENVGKIIGTDYADTIDVDGFFSGISVFGEDGNDAIDVEGNARVGDGDGEDQIMLSGTGNKVVELSNDSDDDTITIDWDYAASGLTFITGLVPGAGDVLRIAVSSQAILDEIKIAQHVNDLAFYHNESGVERLIGLAIDFFDIVNPFDDIIAWFDADSDGVIDGGENSTSYDPDTDLSIAQIRPFSDIIDGILPEFSGTTGLWDPLILDLDDDFDTDQAGSTADLRPAENARTFDFNGDGFTENSGFLLGDDGYLVRDLNANGRIDSGAEMFGSNEESGFEALAAFDSNADGVINSSDTVWSDLLVWKDDFSDLQTQDGELYTLASLGITSFALTGITEEGTTIGGNYVSERSTFTINGEEQAILDVSFAYNTINSRYTGNFTVDPEAILLPQIRGFGQLPDLYIAMSIDNTGGGNLLSLMQSLVADYPTLIAMAENYDSLKSDVVDILYRWAGVEGVSPTSRGDYLEDARHLEFMEKLLGSDWLDANITSPDPGLIQAQEIEQAWQDTLNQMAGRIALQLSGSELFTWDFAYNFFRDSFEKSGSGMFDQDVLDDLSDYAAGLAGTAAREAFWLNVTGLVFDSTAAAGLNFATYEDDLTDAVEASDAALTWEQEGHTPGSVTAIEYKYLNADGDFIEGTSGADDKDLDSTYAGTAEADTIVGLGGADDLAGGDGADALYGHNEDGTGDDGAADILSGGNGNDFLDGGDGNDSLVGGGDQDYLLGGNGNDYLQDGIGTVGSGDQDLLEGGAGDDTYSYRYANSTLKSTVYIEDTAGTDTLVFQNDGQTAGEWQFTLSDLTFTRLSNDGLQIFGHNGSQSFTVRILNQFDDLANSGGAGIEYIRLFDGYGGGANVVTLDLKDHILNWSGNFVTTGTNLSDAIYGIDGISNEIDVHNGDDVVYGGDEDDEIYGGNDNDMLYGLEGDDIIEGEDGDDILDGGEGDDYLEGGTGSDRYIFSNGHDTIVTGFNAYETLEFGAGVAAEDLVAVRTGSGSTFNNLTIELGENSSATIMGYFSLSNTITALAFADGSEISPNSILGSPRITKGSDGADTILGVGGYGSGDKPDVIYGYGGDDDLDGGKNHDILIGGTGADTLEGGPGDDAFVFDIGDGSDTVSDTSGEDVIIFGAGIDPDDLSISYTGDDLNIDYGSDDFDIIDQLDTGDTKQIERVRFDEGSELDLLRYLDWDFGTSSGETLTGSYGVDDIIIGLGGNDTIRGYTGDDILLGSDGNDTLRGYDGADELYGGAGNDKLYGAENDTEDVTDILVGGVGNDQLYGYNGDDILYDITPLDQAALVSEGSSTDKFYGGDGDDTIIIQDGTTNNAWGDDGNDTIKVYFQDDATNGNTFNIRDSDGTDKIIFASLDYDNPNWYFDYGYANPGELRIIYTGTQTDTTVNLKDHYYGIDGSGDPLFAMDLFEFGDGTLIDFRLFWVTEGTANTTETLAGSGGEDYIITNSGDTTVNAGDAMDFVHGDTGADIINGQDGDDFLFGGAGNDTINGGNGIDRVNGGEGNDTINGDDGDDALLGGNGANTVHGNLGDDYLSGGNDVDTLFGDEGADDLNGGYGNDILYGDGDGTELYAGGADTMNGSYGDDTLYGGGGNDYVEGYDGLDTLYGGDGNDILVGGRDYWDTTDEDDVLYGNDGNDTLYGGGGDDTLVGGDGGDTLWGGDDADTFVLETDAYGDNNRIMDFDTTEGDAVDLTDLLTAYDPMTDLITDFVEITDDGTHSYLAVDADGGADNFVQILKFQSTLGLTDEASLETNGHLIAA